MAKRVDPSCGCCVCIQTSTVGMLESFGKFERTLEPGCHCFNPCLKSVSGIVSSRVISTHVSCPSKTQDNVMVTFDVVIQYRVKTDRAADAFYRFSNAQSQISSYVVNVIRGEAPKHTLDELFLQRDEIEVVLKQQLDQQLDGFGYVLVSALITDINPAREVQEAMNMINVNARLKIAQQHKSEAEKFETVKAAEAEAEAKRLSGVGLAEQRKAAILGLQSSVESFHQNVPEMTPKDIMSLLLMNQYFDAIKDIADHGRSTTIFTTSGQDTHVMEGLVATNSTLRKRQ